MKNGVKLSELNAVTPSAINRISTTSLMITMIVFVRALSLTPTMRTDMTTSTRNAAVRLTVPPSSRGSEIASGSENENTDSSSSLR